MIHAWSPSSPSSQPRPPHCLRFTPPRQGTSIIEGDIHPTPSAPCLSWSHQGTVSSRLVFVRFQDPRQRHIQFAVVVFIGRSQRCLSLFALLLVYPPTVLFFGSLDCVFLYIMIDFPSPILSITSDVVSELDGEDAIYGLWTRTYTLLYCLSHELIIANVLLVFTKCKVSLKDGRRLENISWRLWYREMSNFHRSPPHSTGSVSPPLSDIQTYSPITPSSEYGSNGNLGEHNYMLLCCQITLTVDFKAIPHRMACCLLQKHIRPTPCMGRFWCHL